jgi:hypothetical protein
MLNELKTLLDEAKNLRKQISALKVNSVSKKELMVEAEEIGNKWFADIIDELKLYPFLNESLLKNYSEFFSRLIKISAPNNLKKSYLEILDKIIKKFRDEIIIPIQQNPNSFSNQSLLKKYLDDLKYAEESEYLKEAFECAHNNHFRAATVLGWCAAIDRIHRKIEQLGFPKFNVTSSMMASQQKGRFKKFSSPQNINSLSELREVFDNISLWIIEGMDLIESNQHTRLKSCFDLRCQCAHPCDAPVTEYNLLSYFSDLHEIIFNNPKFDLS